MSMFRNYLVIAFRNLIRKKTYSVINIIGLASGIAFCLLVYLYVSHELSFDRFHSNVDRLYRLETSFHRPDKKEASEKSLFSFLPEQDEEKNQVVMPVILAP